jgi:carbamoyl-phosphate synthase large subunit
MQIVYSDAELSHYMRFAVEASPERPVLVDKFLEDATEVDVDCIADVGHFKNPGDGTIVIGGMLEHIEFAGVHSGDAAMVLPPHTLSKKVIETIREYTHAMARELKVIGLMNVQYAVKGDKVYRARSQSARVAHRAVREQGHRRAAGQARRQSHGRKDLKELGFTKEIWPKYWAVKESVFPFNRFHGQDILLSPEMRSTGEVMGLDADRGIAYAKSQMAAGSPLPLGGKVFISVSDAHKKEVARWRNNLPTWALNWWPPAARRRSWKRPGLKVQRIFKLPKAGPTRLTCSRTRKSSSSSTPQPARRRAPTR